MLQRLEAGATRQTARCVASLGRSEGAPVQGARWRRTGCQRIFLARATIHACTMIAGEVSPLVPVAMHSGNTEEHHPPCNACRSRAIALGDEGTRWDNPRRLANCAGSWCLACASKKVAKRPGASLPCLLYTRMFRGHQLPQQLRCTAWILTPGHKTDCDEGWPGTQAVYAYGFT